MNKKEHLEIAYDIFREIEINMNEGDYKGCWLETLEKGIIAKIKRTKYPNTNIPKDMDEVSK